MLNKLPSKAFKLFADMAEKSRDDQTKLPRGAATSAPSASNAKLDKICLILEQLVMNISVN